MAKRAGRGRERGHIRKRGNSYQVLMYAGIDPITGKEIRLAESTSDPNEAERIQTGCGSRSRSGSARELRRRGTRRSMTGCGSTISRRPRCRPTSATSSARSGPRSVRSQRTKKTPLGASRCLSATGENSGCADNRPGGVLPGGRPEPALSQEDLRTLPGPRRVPLRCSVTVRAVRGLGRPDRCRAQGTPFRAREHHPTHRMEASGSIAPGGVSTQPSARRRGRASVTSWRP